MTNYHTKKRIAILTWRLRNFGTALQAYALCRWLRNNGVESRLINYTLPSSDRIIRVNPVTVSAICMKIWRRLINLYETRQNKACISKYKREIIEAQKHFAYFYSRIPVENTKPEQGNASFFNSEYDCVIVGSDQVWSPKYLTETYFLDFVNDDKKVAYAPSLGVGTLTEAEHLFISERIKKFRYLSIREKTSARLLGIRDEFVMCDPVLLFTGGEWNSMLKITPPLEKENYLFVYTLSAKNWYKDAIEQARCIYGVDRVIVVTASDRLFFYDSSKYEVRIGEGPIEWVEQLQNAKAVVTDSFHGVCFSVIYNQDFVVLKRFADNDKSNENARVSDLLEELGLSGHILNKNEKFDKRKFVLNSLYVNKLNEFKGRSADYLFSILQNLTN